MDKARCNSSFHEGSERVVKLLIERGGDVNAMSEDGTPLHCAANGDSVECIRLLLEHGADVKARLDGWTMLHYAMQHKKPRDAARLFIEAGVDVNAVNDEGWTPMHILLDEYRQLDEMLEYDVDMAHDDTLEDDVAIMYDGTWGDDLAMTLDTAQLLVTNGADMNSDDVEGATPLFLIYEAMLMQMSPIIGYGAFDQARRFYDKMVRLEGGSNACIWCGCSV